jgi:protein ImuB
MPLTEAEALVSQRQAGSLSYVHDSGADLTVLARLAEQCERFSPLVGWETVESTAGKRSAAAADPLGPSALFLDVTGIGVLFGGEEQLLLAVQEEFTRQGYRAKLSIAGSIGAAWALTFGGNTLGSLPIHTLRVPHETVDLLAQLGVTTIGQLLELPRDSLASRFGERLPLRLAQALGEAGEVIAPHHPLPSYEADWILDVPRGDWECLELIVQELLKRITATMTQRQEGAVRLVCRLDCAGTAPLRLEVGLFRPSAVAKHLWELVRMQLEQRSLPGPVGRVTVQVVQSAPLECRQSELFGGSVLEGTRELSLLIDRLSGRLGMNAVVRPELARDPLPEKAFREMPLAGQFLRRVGPVRSRQRSSAHSGRRAVAGARRPTPTSAARRCPVGARELVPPYVRSLPPAGVVRAAGDPGGAIGGARRAADPLLVPRARLPRGSLLGTGANRDRLVAGEKRAAGLLPRRDRGGGAVLALPAAGRRGLGNAGGVLTIVN